MTKLDVNACNNADRWLNGCIDESTKQEILRMREENPEEFNDAFYRTLEFGTGGLRGIMGLGTNRMNFITVSMTTQGFCNYIKQKKTQGEVRCVISHDSRNNSRNFALTTARVMAANGFKVFLFEDMRPTPELSFAVRELKADAGVMITASHNPKEYNGYKAYWNDGAQLTAPDDELVIEQVNKITDISQVKTQQGDENITIIGKDIDQVYIDRVKSLSLDNGYISRNKGLKIVYTPLHGTGIKLIPQALKAYGFDNVSIVEPQAVADGNFPTCVSPNPEEPAALELGLQQAQRENADILLATDPDADREALAVKKKNGEWILLNGNQTASLFTYYLLKRWSEEGRLTGNQYIIKTIVTTELVRKIAESFNVECYDTLTGFKHIAAKIKSMEGKKEYIGGGEESFGYLIGDFVRDKDSVSGCCILAEMAAYASDKGQTLYDMLLDIYAQYGFYQEKQVSIVRKGQSGAEEIKAMMTTFRTNPHTSLAGEKVERIADYLECEKTGLPSSNVLQYFLSDGSKVSVRPSGTEPKIKFYFSICSKFEAPSLYEQKQTEAMQKIETLKHEMGLN
ncbi:MAG: phospho-sugar mutase [Candidatus Onthomorpha sp.]|nr:phospho-sugar mutase [Bacteroidales bacterium]MDY4862524.1 phospho-sugar mutase [Candidatus Onthomorpha sp.]MDD5961977.1 phospho-sugar mutase [Bacteroidales bacterium]MDD7539470.1 phospho-sugar mutase [Bacteroidales bacterium]MDD7589715.1 phospho-sugar mutase [Bacteroidales bacterium]